MRYGGRWGVWLVVGLLVAATGILVLWLADVRPAALQGRDNQIRLTALFAILAFVASGLFRGSATQPTLRWVHHGSLWVGFGLVLVLGYSFRGDIDGLWRRLQVELIPGRAVEIEAGTVMVRAGDDGHFRVDAVIDGTELHVLVDTGATLVTLNRDDAERIGIELDRLVYSQPVRTAKGMDMGALLRLREIRIGPVVVRDVEAMVSRAAMGSSLLGQSFLNRLGSYAVSEGTLTMRR